MPESVCKLCIFFVRHYIPGNNASFIKAECGHCLYGKTKHRSPNAPACGHFLKRPQQAEASE